MISLFQGTRICTSGSVVEYRLAKARVAGSNPVSCSQRDRKKESSDGWLFFLCSSPAGLERFECLRSAAVVAGERPPDVLRRLVLSKKCEKEEISDGYLLFLYVRSCRVRTVRMSTLRCGRRRRTSPGRSSDVSCFQ